MFAHNDQRGQNLHSPSTSEASMDQITQYGLNRRQMGPPLVNGPPQPVEIDPISYPRTTGSYTLWDQSQYSTCSAGAPTPPLSSALGLHRTAQMSHELGTRHSFQDPLANWYSGNDAPWIPKGAMPEAPPDDQLSRKTHPFGCRNSGLGSPSRIPNKAGYHSENGSVLFGVSQCDSGYGTGVSLESSSVRGSDIADHNMDNRSMISRLPDIPRCLERGFLREPLEGGLWTLNPPNPLPYRCETCHKSVKNKSELKKHHLRHTKPFNCPKSNCTRVQGFSTVNDLDRHMKSRHLADLLGDIPLKTYRCLYSGCKSKDKIWPRLDNFRSHLKRIHHLLEDSDIDVYVNGADVDQRMMYCQKSQEIAISAQRILNGEVSTGLGTEDFSRLPYSTDPPQWRPMTPNPLHRQAVTGDPLLESANTQILSPPDGECTPDADDAPISLDSQVDCEASCEPSSGSLSPEKDPDMQLCTRIGDSIGSFLPDPSESVMDTPDIIEKPETGKVPKEKQVPRIDPCLRVAISAVLSAVSGEKKDKAGFGPSVPKRNRSLQVIRGPGVPLGSSQTGLERPSSSDPSAGKLGSQSLSMESQSTFGADSKDLIDQDERLQWLLEAIKEAGYVLKKDNRTSIGPGQTVGNSGAGGAKKRDQVTCTRCTKFRGRPCELKKHMKRHDRPYGCTFNKCQKTFGSKNDWKRHENSQHFQQDTWSCNEESDDGVPCGKVFYTAENARAHLTKIHKVIDRDAIERKLDDRYIGSNYQVKFWCGFCEEVIRLRQRGLAAWTERFNHIDDHFMGRNGRKKQSILQWKPVEDDKVQISTSSVPPNDGTQESSDMSSPLSSHSSSGSPESAPLHSSGEIAPTMRKRKRTDSDEGGKMKHSRTSKSESRIECCQCFLNCNPKTETACPIDSHTFCGDCEKKQVAVGVDPQ